MSFSERYGYKPVRNAFQIESMDDALRNGFWSLLQVFLWNNAGDYDRYSGATYIKQAAKQYCRCLWMDHFKIPVDTLPNTWPVAHGEIRDYFFKAKWFEVYDFIEFSAKNFPSLDKDSFTAACNTRLEIEASAYRFVDGVITRITDESEVAEIELALRSGQSDPVRIHLRCALERLSDRKNPDYRNSIKESISAVESLVCNIVGEKGTLGQLIKKMENEIGLHPALRTAFSNLYGYTSNEDGIRHAILESQNVGFDEAKFFLVVCSTFTNFVQVKIATLKK
jgi:hypothetical protein